MERMPQKDEVALPVSDSVALPVLETVDVLQQPLTLYEAPALEQAEGIAESKKPCTYGSCP